MSRLLTLSGIVLVAACATTPDDRHQIAIQTVAGGRALIGADCEVFAGSQAWTIRTPKTIQTGPASGDLRVVCNKPGYRTAELVYRASGAAGGMGVQIGGGSGGVGVGLSFPIGRRAVADYPSQLTVEMRPE